MPIDEAYGGFFILTEHGRRALRGVDQADSITVDSHKGMFMPTGTGCVLVRDGQLVRAARPAHVAYLRDIRADTGACFMSHPRPRAPLDGHRPRHDAVGLSDRA